MLASEVATAKVRPDKIIPDWIKLVASFSFIKDGSACPDQYGFVHSPFKPIRRWSQAMRLENDQPHGKVPPRGSVKISI